MGKLANMVKVASATTGTGTLTLGLAASGFQTFANGGIANGDVVTYLLEQGTNREIGTGTYTSSGTTLTRTTVLGSTNAGGKISLAAGGATVSISPSAEDFIALRVVNTASAVVTAAQTLTATTMTAITGLTVNLTPLRSDSIIRIQACINVDAIRNSDSLGFAFELRAGSTSLNSKGVYLDSSSGSAFLEFNDDVSFDIDHSPGSTAQVTYSIRGMNSVTGSSPTMTVSSDGTNFSNIRATEVFKS